MPVIADEASALPIEGLPYLPRAGERFHHQGFGMKAPVVLAGLHRRAVRVFGCGHLPSRQPARQVDPSIGAKNGRSNPQLLAAAIGKKTGQDHFPFVRHPVAIDVLEVDHVRSVGHEETLLPWHNSIRESQPAGEFRTLLEAPVPIRILQSRNSSELRLRQFPPHGMRVAPALDNEKTPIGVEAKGHGIDRLGFRGNQFDPQVIRLQPKGGQRLLGRKWLSPRNLGKER